MLTKRATFYTLILITLIVAACTDQGSGNATGDGVPTPLPLEIRCELAYRQDRNTDFDREETILFTASDNEDEIILEDLVFRGKFDTVSTPPYERAMIVSVSPYGGIVPLTSQLYQLTGNDMFYNQFSGGHGFTGLHYVNHPNSNAELQYFCLFQVPES